MNNPLPIVFLTIILLILGIALGCMSGVPEVITVYGNDNHNQNNMQMTATQRNLEATNDVIKSTQDYHAMEVTSTAIPLIQTSSVQNVQMAMAAMQNNATQAAFSQNLQGAAAVEQFKFAQTANAQNLQATLEVEKFELTRSAIRRSGDQDQYHYSITQTQVALEQEIIKKGATQKTIMELFSFGAILMCFTLFIILAVCMLLWVLGRFRNANTG